jgi:hypothetical protein
VGGEKWNGSVYGDKFRPTSRGREMKDGEDRKNDDNRGDNRLI